MADDPEITLSPALGTTIRPPAPAKPACLGLPANQLSNADMAEIDAYDSVLGAHLRRQRDWERDAVDLFPGETAAEAKQRKLLQDSSDLQVANQKRVADSQAAQAVAEARANAGQRQSEIAAQLKQMAEQSAALKAEAKQLAAGG